MSTNKQRTGRITSEFQWNILTMEGRTGGGNIKHQVTPIGNMSQCGEDQTK